MKTLIHQNHTEIILNHSRANVFNPSFFSEFEKILSQVGTNENIIIKGNSHFFSSGIDLFYTLDIDRQNMKNLIRQFEQILETILFRKGKIIANINGHSVAGGFILACACDLVYYNQDTLKMGINEKKIGIKLPPLAEKILNYTFKDNSEKILKAKEFYNSSDMEEFSIFTNKKVNFKSLTKDLSRQQKIKNFVVSRKENDTEDFLDLWFSKISIKLRSQLAISIQSKNLK